MAIDLESLGRKLNTRKSRDAKYPPTMLARVASVDKAANTMDVKIVGGLHDGEEISGLSFTGRTSAKRLLEKGKMGFVGQEAIDAGSVLVSIDGYNSEKKQARWYNSAGVGAEAIVSTEAEPSFMRLIKTRGSWPETEDDAACPRYIAVVAETGKSASVESLEQFQSEFLRLADHESGSGSFTFSLIINGERIDADQYVQMKDGSPVKSAEDRLNDLLESLGGQEGVSEILKEGTITFTPTYTAGTLSRYSTEKMIAEFANGDTMMDRFHVRGHAARIQASLYNKSDAEVAKVQDAWGAWCKESGFEGTPLEDASGDMIERFAVSKGVEIPPLKDGMSGWLPTSMTLITVNNDEEKPPVTFVNRVLQSAQNPLPFRALPIAGDEEAPQSYYAAHPKLISAIIEGPKVTSEKGSEVKADAQTEAKAERPKPTSTEAEDSIEDEDLDDILSQMNDPEDDDNDPDMR